MKSTQVLLPNGGGARPHWGGTHIPFPGDKGLPGWGASLIPKEDRTQPPPYSEEHLVPEGKLRPLGRNPELFHQNPTLPVSPRGVGSYQDLVDKWRVV